MQKNRLTYIVALFFLLTLLSVATPYLHNHEPDLLEHEDCVAYALSTIFSLGIISIVLFITYFLSKTNIFPLDLFHVYFYQYASRPTRAPPLSFLKLDNF